MAALTLINGPSHQFTAGNLSANLHLPDETEQYYSDNPESIELCLRNIDGHKVGKITFGELSEDAAGELFQDLIHSGTRFLDETKADNKKPIYPAEALKKIIDRAGSLGAVVESENFGEESHEIVKRYQLLANASMSHRIKILDTENCKAYSGGKICLTEKAARDKNIIIWIDISANLEMSDLQYHQIEDLLIERFPGLKTALLQYGKEGERDLAFLETRVFSRDPRNPFCVIRDKFYALVESNILVTVHDRDLPAIESLWRATENKCTEKLSSSVSLAQKILDNVYKQNEKIIRRLEKGADRMQDRQSEIVAGKARQEMLDNISTLERTARYVQRKTTETLTSMHQFASLLNQEDVTDPVKSKKLLRAENEHESLRTKYSELRDRAVDILSASNSIRETNSAIVAGYSNNVNEKLTKLGALFAPSVTALSAMEVFPNLQPHWRFIIGGSVMVSSVLLWGLHKVAFWRR